MAVVRSARLSRAAALQCVPATSSSPTVTESSPWFPSTMPPEVAQLTVAKVGSERQRKAEIEKGVLVRPEIDETLRRLKVIE